MGLIRPSRPRKIEKTDFLSKKKNNFNLFEAKKRSNHQILHTVALTNTYPIDSKDLSPDPALRMASIRSKLDLFRHFC